MLPLTEMVLKNSWMNSRLNGNHSTRLPSSMLTNKLNSRNWKPLSLKPTLHSN
jgi:hypothetical protein